MIEVFIINKSQLMCDLIATALENEPNIQVIGLATRVKGAIGRIRAVPCHVVLVSASLPNGGALELTQTLNMVAAVKVLIMDLPEVKEVVLQYIEAGATGYVSRNASVSELTDNIRAVYSGKALVSPEIAAALISRLSELSAACFVKKDVNGCAGLTARQVQILGLIRDGLTNRQIADRLVIEEGTVKNHVHNILDKLEVQSRNDAAIYWNSNPKTPVNHRLDGGQALSRERAWLAGHSCPLDI